MTVMKVDQADLDSPCQELSNGGLGIVAALLVCWTIIFVGSYWTSNPAVGVQPVNEWALTKLPYEDLASCSVCMLRHRLRLRGRAASTATPPPAGRTWKICRAINKNHA